MPAVPLRWKLIVLVVATVVALTAATAFLLLRAYTIVTSPVLVADDLASARSLCQRVLQADDDDVLAADGIASALPVVEAGGANVMLTHLSAGTTRWSWGRSWCWS